MIIPTRTNKIPVSKPTDIEPALEELEKRIAVIKRNLDTAIAAIEALTGVPL